MDNSEEESVPVAWAKPYRQVNSIGSKAKFGLTAIAVYALATIALDVWLFLELSGEPSEPILQLIENISLALLAFYLLAFLSTVICFCRWKHRSYSNLPALGVVSPRNTPGWAVGSYFVPIVNLFGPFRAMKDIWNGSLGRGAQEEVWQVTQWWAAWIFMGVTTRAADRLVTRAETIEAFKVAVLVELGSLVAVILAAWLAIRLITKVSEYQTARAKELGLINDSEGLFTIE